MITPSPESEPRGSGIQVITRAAQVLRAIRDSPGGSTQAELAERLGMPRTTVHRILNALEEEELVAAGRGMRGRYRIGPEVMRLASSASRELVALMRPLLVELSQQLGETVDLSMLDAGSITFIDQVDAPHRLRAASAVGESFPLHSCAPGKALLASLSPSRLAEVLPTRLPALTSHTVTSIPELRDQLDEIRRTGIAYDYEEQNDGICAAGTAVVAAGVSLAVSIPMPAQRFVGREADCAQALQALHLRLDRETWV